MELSVHADTSNPSSNQSPTPESFRKNTTPQHQDVGHIPRAFKVTVRELKASEGVVRSDSGLSVQGPP